MNLWCCLCFNQKEKEEEEQERCDIVEPMNNDEDNDNFGNVFDDEEGEDVNYDPRFIEYGREAFGSWQVTQGESSSVNAAVAPGSPVADESRDSSHKRAKFYK